MMKIMTSCRAIFFILATLALSSTSSFFTTDAFSTTSNTRNDVISARSIASRQRQHRTSSSSSKCSNTSLSSTASATFPSSPSNHGESDASPAAGTTSEATTKQIKRLQQIRKEGGPLAFNTKFGALNPFAIYYGLVSIVLGVVWFMALTACQLMYTLTGNRVDRKRRIPVFLSHVWGTLLMMLTGCFPRVENGEIVKNFHRR